MNRIGMERPITSLYFPIILPIPTANSLYNRRMKPMIVHANWYRFRRGERIRNAHVGSRMFLYGKSGKGTVRVNGKVFGLAPDGFLFLPWNHDISYQPEDEDPFFVGAIHLVPDYEGPAIYYVPHAEDDPFARAPNRTDAPIPNIDGIVSGDFGLAPRLFHLAEYIVERFNPSPLPASTSGDGMVREEDSRMLASLFVEELSAVAKSGDAIAGSCHPAWVRMRSFIQDHLADEITVASLAEAGGTSAATAARVFGKMTGTSPARYIQRARMDRAESLIRTTSFSLGEIGARVGIEDPYYFSRLFKRIKGVPPSRIRRSSRPI
jgi:AraC-like DNA-binding protein